MINNNFDEASWEAFQEAASEKYDFGTCQRPDGSYYGTSGQCRKGSPVAGGVPKKEKKGGKASGGGVSDAQAAALSKDLTRQIGAAAKKGDKKAVDNLMLAKSTVDGQIKARAAASGGGGPTRSEISDKRKEVRAMDKTAKAAEKKAESADKAWRKAGMPKGDQQKEVRRLDKIAKSADKEATRADKELQRMTKSASSAKKRESNVKINKALESGNKSDLRKAKADIGGKIAKLEAAGKPVPKSMRATSKLINNRLES